MQRPQLVEPLGARVRAPPDELPDDLEVPVPGRVVQRGHGLLVAAVHGAGRAGVAQHVHHALQVAILGELRKKRKNDFI